MPNGLAGETSPYLLQHANNPVDWMPWGSAALARAKLLIVRSSCRSATRPAIGATSWSANRSRTRRRPDFLNDRFVSIKVDREERPDLDAIYMNAVQAMTGSAAAGRCPSS